MSGGQATPEQLGERRRGRQATFAFLVVLLGLGATAPASADDDDPPELVKMRFFERGSQLLVSTSLTKLFDSAAYDKLDDGLEALVVIRCWVYPKGGDEALSFQLVQRRAYLHVWDEDYKVTLEESGRQRSVAVKYKAEALKLLTSIDSLPVALLKNIPYEKQYVLAMVVELNPVSQETLAEVRRWLSEGNGGGLERGGTLFGSFMSIFVNLKIPEADRVLRLRSQPFYRPTPPAPVPPDTAYPPPAPPPPPSARPAGPPARKP